jgi:predicted methyltransferase MtxX (methanogen marker protein 4)
MMRKTRAARQRQVVEAIDELHDEITSVETRKAERSMIDLLGEREVDADAEGLDDATIERILGRAQRDERTMKGALRMLRFAGEMLDDLRTDLRDELDREGPDA